MAAFAVSTLDGQGFKRVSAYPLLNVQIMGKAADGSWVGPFPERALLDTGANETALDRSLGTDRGFEITEVTTPPGSGLPPTVGISEIRLIVVSPQGDIHSRDLTINYRPTETGTSDSFRITIGADFMDDCRLTCDYTGGQLISWPDGRRMPVGTFILERSAPEP